MPLSEEGISEIVNKLCLETESYAIEPAEEITGFQGVYYSLRIKPKKGNEIKYFIKSIPEGSKVVNDFYEGLSTFVKEVKVYRDIFPLMKRYTARNLWPECYLSKEGRFLVLEDMEDSGWRTPKTMNFEHLVKGLEGLAEFHAASMALEMGDLGEVLEETMFSEMGRPGRIMWDSFCRVMAQTVQRYLPETNVDVFGYLQSAIDNVKPSTRFHNCLNHGDPWMNNMFFYYSSDEPSRSLFVDFQSARIAPPALDLSIFLYIFRPEQADQFAFIYYEKLVATLKRNNSLSLSLEEFNESLQHYKGTGITIATLYIFLTKLPVQYLSKILISQETFIPFALGHDYSPALTALQEDSSYREIVLRSLQRVISHYSKL